MTYACDLNIYLAQLGIAVKLAKGLMTEHADSIEPWMWHRLENMNAEMNALVKTMKDHCKEVVE